MADKGKPNIGSMYQSYAWNMKKYKQDKSAGRRKYLQNANKWYEMYKKFGGKRKRLK